MSDFIEIEVTGMPMCLWATLIHREDGRKFLRVQLNGKKCQRAKTRLDLAPSESATVARYDREDRRVAKNNGGGYR